MSTKPDPNQGLQSVNAFLRERNMRAGVQLAANNAARAAVEEDLTGRYHVGVEIAKGGMGAILEAQDLNTRRSVAMKVMLPVAGVSDENVARFIEEAQITAQLEHPGIVPVYELAVDAQGNVFYTMKFVRGRTLKDIIEGIEKKDPETLNDYPLNRLLNLFIKICETMAYAHSRGVIHRDLKPENLMIGAFGEVMIMDWGLAKVVAVDSEQKPDEAPDWSTGELGEISYESAQKTVEGAVLGTPAYMAPEQVLGQISKLDARSDVYALGGILYTLLALRHAVPRGQIHTMMLSVVDGSTIPIAETVAETQPAHLPDGKVPDGLAAVVAKAMAQEQDDRYASAQDLRADVEAWQAGRATTAEAAGFGRQLSLLIKRHRGKVAAATVAAAAFLVLGAVFLVRLNTEKQRAEKSAVIAEENASRANEALAAFEAEQARLKKTQALAAPAMIRAARLLIGRGDLDGAMQQVLLAKQYAPELPEANWLCGVLQVVDEAYAPAAESLALYLEKMPDDEDAKQIRALCLKSPEMLPIELRTQLAPLFAAKGEWRLVDFLRLDKQRLLEMHKTRIMEALGRGTRIGQTEDGKLSLILDRSIKDLSPIRNMPIAELTIPQKANFSNLGPLEGMPLEKLVIDWRNNVSDIGPLAGMPLRELVIRGGPVSDLGPLVGMPLEILDVTGTNVSDLSPLKDLPLRELRINHTKVKSLDPLRNLPLEAITVPASEWFFIDLRPLNRDTLKELIVDRVPTQKYAEVIGEFRKLDKLLIANPVGLDSLAPFEGLPLRELRMTYSGGRKIDDLSHLRGMPLEIFQMERSQITSIEPLRGMPLKVLLIRYNGEVDDAETEAVLRTLTRLERLVLPTPTVGLGFLDKLPELKSLGDDKFVGEVHEYREHRAKAGGAAGKQ